MKVWQTEVLNLHKQYVTNVRFTALGNTLRAILNVCFKIVWKRDIPKAPELFIIHISFMWLFWGSLVRGSCHLYLQNSKWHLIMWINVYVICLILETKGYSCSICDIWEVQIAMCDNVRLRKLLTLKLCTGQSKY